MPTITLYIPPSAFGIVPAQHIGTELENFNIVAATNDGFSVRVDTGGGWGAAQPVTIGAGAAYTADILAIAINASGITGITCSDNGGYLQIDSISGDAGSRFELLAVANDVYTEVGLTTGVYETTYDSDAPLYGVPQNRGLICVPLQEGRLEYIRAGGHSFQDWQFHPTTSGHYSDMLRFVHNGLLEVRLDGTVQSPTDLITLFKTYYQEL